MFSPQHKYANRTSHSFWFAQDDGVANSMSKSSVIANSAVVSAVRDRLLDALAELDQLGETMAAIELNSAIEILNQRLREPTGQVAIDKLLRQLMSD